jgi:hypothetical protein
MHQLREPKNSGRSRHAALPRPITHEGFISTLNNKMVFAANSEERIDNCNSKFEKNEPENWR